MSQTVVIICSAIPIVIVDIYFQKYRDKFASKMLMRNILNVIQIIINILYVYMIMIINNNFSKHYQITLPGIFFPGFLFSLQAGMFTDIRNNISVGLLQKK
jgi:Trm5-related predicted tRNA methylase